MFFPLFSFVVCCLQMHACMHEYIHEHFVFDCFLLWYHWYEKYVVGRGRTPTFSLGAGQNLKRKKEKKKSYGPKLVPPMVVGVLLLRLEILKRVTLKQF